jgi:hypothetical protein
MSNTVFISICASLIIFYFNVNGQLVLSDIFSSHNSSSEKETTQKEKRGLRGRTRRVKGEGHQNKRPFWASRTRNIVNVKSSANFLASKLKCCCTPQGMSTWSVESTMSLKNIICTQIRLLPCRNRNNTHFLDPKTLKIGKMSSEILPYKIRLHEYVFSQNMIYIFKSGSKRALK